MTDNQEVVQENKPSDKELNFRKLEERYQRELDRERLARAEAEKIAREALSQRASEGKEDDEDEPYVGHKNLEKKLSNFERKIEEKIDKRAEEKARVLLDQEKKESWLRNNGDFYDVMQNVEKFAKHDPELAESILQMPDGFERQKLVYKNIKALGLDKPAQKQPSIQDKVDANRKSPYYQPSGPGSAPYASQSDFSPVGQKNAYQKMQDLISRRKG